MLSWPATWFTSGAGQYSGFGIFHGHLPCSPVNWRFIQHTTQRTHPSIMPVQLSLTGFAWKNLWRRRLRTLLTLCGIGMAIGAFVALVGFSRSFETEWLRLYSSSGTDIAVVDKNFMNSSVDQGVGESARRSPRRTGRADDLQHHGPDAGG